MGLHNVLLAGAQTHGRPGLVLPSPSGYSSIFCEANGYLKIQVNEDIDDSISPTSSNVNHTPPQWPIIGIIPHLLSFLL